MSNQRKSEVKKYTVRGNFSRNMNLSILPFSLLTEKLHLVYLFLAVLTHLRYKNTATTTAGIRSSNNTTGTATAAAFGPEPSDLSFSPTTEK